MRRDPTPAEEVLWEALRGRRLAGLEFRRQYAVERVVLDFYRPSAHLVVEVDGDVHDSQRDRGRERTAWLEARGFRVIRFRNDHVLSDLPGVLRRIEESATGSPPLPLAGEGAGG